MANNQQGAGNRGGSGKVADERQRAPGAGRKDGEHGHGQASGHQPKTTQQGSGGTFSDQRAKTSDLAKKGGPNY